MPEQVITFSIPTFQQPLRLTLRRSGFSLDVSPRGVFHFDRTGKLVRAAIGERTFRGRLAPRILENWTGTPPRNAKRLTGPDRLALVHAALQDVLAVHHALVGPEGDDSLTLVAERLGRAVRYHSEQPEKGKARFHKAAPPLTVLPPDQHMAVVLHATEGGDPGVSAFTHQYRHATPRPRTLPEFVAHMEEVKRSLGRALERKRSVLLGPADALGVRQPVLMRMLDAIGATFNITPPMLDRGGKEFYPPHEPGELHGIYCFADPAKGLRKRAGDFRELVRRHLRRIYLPVDSGDDELLAMAGSPITGGQILQTALAAKRGGMRLGVIVALGVGGKRFADRHVRRTTLLLNLMELDPEDILFFRPLLVVPGTPYARRAARARLAPLDDADMLAQRDAFAAALNLADPQTAPATATYTLNKFLY